MKRKKGRIIAFLLAGVLLAGILPGSSVKAQDKSVISVDEAAAKSNFRRTVQNALDQAAEQAEVGVRRGHAVDEHLADRQIADRVTGQRQADDRNRRPDDDRGHQLVDPRHTGDLYDQRDHDIHQTGEQRTEHQTEVAELRVRRTGGGHRTGEGREHRADECERAAEEHRAAEFGEQQIDDRADACAEQRGGLLHPVADDRRHGDGRRQDRQQLLEREHDQATELGLIADVVDQFHPISSCKKRGCRSSLSGRACGDLAS